LLSLLQSLDGKKSIQDQGHSAKYVELGG
jgi:hypothetical protein